MRAAVPLYPYDRWGGLGPLGAAVRRADQLGFDAVSLPEHIVMPVRPGVPPVSAVWYDNFVLAAHLATLTERIRFDLHALVVPYRNPVEAAKMIATLDLVSGGRLTVVAGTGWMPREFAILGVPFEDRGERTDEYLRAMKVLWTEPQPSYTGRHVSFSDLVFEPRCVQRPHVPIWIGGSGARPMDRVIELGDGWAPMTGTLDELAVGIRQLRQRAAAVGRDPDRLEFAAGIRVGPVDEVAAAARGHVARGRPTVDDDEGRAGTRDEVLALVRRAAAIGVTQLSLGFAWETPDDYIAQLEQLAVDVLPAVHAAG